MFVLLRSLGWMTLRLMKPRLPLLDSSVLRLMVWPSDVNFSLHMDNVRYLKLMDLARRDFFTRCGITRVVLRQRLAMPIAAAHVNYRRSLLMWQKFELHTRVLAWDEKWFFIEQRFMRNGQSMAEAFFKCVVLRQGQFTPPAEFFAQVGGQPLASPPIPPAVRTWFSYEPRATHAESVYPDDREGASAHHFIDG